MKKKTGDYNGYFKHLSNSFIKNKKQYEIYNNYYKKNILKHIPQDKSLKIIDVGCGLGHMLYFLRENKYEGIEGIDIVDENIKLCIDAGFKCKKENLFNFFKSDKKFDIIIANNLLEHFSYEEIEKILNLFYSKLSENGKIIIIVPNCNNIYGITTFFSDITHKSPLTEKSMTDIIFKTPIKSFQFFNLIVYPKNIIFDPIFKFFNIFRFQYSKIMSLINGQKPFKVYSKNLLLIIKK